MKNAMAKIRTLKSREKHFAYVGINRAVRRFRLMFEALQESMQDLMLEIVPGKSLDNLLP